MTKFYQDDPGKVQCMIWCSRWINGVGAKPNELFLELW